MIGRLHFRLAEDLPAGHGHLHFGIHPNTLTAVAATIAPAAVTVALVTLGPVPLTAVAATVAPPVQTAATATLSWHPITASATSVAPGAISHVHAYIWYRARRDSSVSYTIPIRTLAGQEASWGLPVRTRRDKDVTWSLPDKGSGNSSVSWSVTDRVHATETARWGLFDVTERGGVAAWQHFLTAEVLRRLTWTAPGPALWHVGRVMYDIAPGAERRERVRWELFADVVRPVTARWDYAPLRIWSGDVRWSRFLRRSWDGPVPVPKPPNPPPVHPGGPGRLFFHLLRWPVSPGFDSRLHFGRKYFVARSGINMITDLSLFKLPNLEPIRFQSLSIEEAMDSLRLLRVTIRDRASYLLLQPDEDYNPAEVRAVLNGYSWDFVVLESSGIFSFADVTFTANGKSRIVYLGAPYAPSRDYREDNTRTIHQLADQEVENTGFEIVWDTADWLVPAGTFSYQNLTPLDVLRRLAGTPGAYVSDDPIALEVAIAPRYSIEPWLWAQQQPVTTITASQAKSLTIQNLRYDDTNRVVVSGGNTGKVRVVATRSGTAGDHSKALYTDTLICAVEAGTERARQSFSAAGRHQDVILTGIPLAPSPGDPKLLHLGDLVRVEWLNDDSWIGMVTGVKVNAQFGSLLMDCTLDRFLET